MSLNTFLLRAAFGGQQIPDEYEFVLLRRGNPVQGYTPPKVKRGAWKVRDHAVWAAVSFSGAGPLTFDQVQVRADGTEVDVFDVGEATLPPGMAFEFEATFDLDAA